jgi:glycosyltransferase involved in cell wall biosynthesis
MHTKILFVVNGHAYTARHRLPLIAAFERAGFDVHCAAPAGSAAFKILREDGYSCSGLPMSRRGVNPLQELRTVIAMVRLYRRLRPKVVYHATIKPVLYGSLAARLSGSPTVMNAITGLGSVFITRGLKAVILRWVVVILYRLAFYGLDALVLFQNSDDQEYLTQKVGLRRNQCFLVRGSGVDTVAFAPLHSAETNATILFAGRMLRDKGVPVFVEAARIVRRSIPNARFALVGDPDPGNPSSLSVSQLRKWQSEGSVDWWGARCDMPRVYAQASVVVLPSLREGLPKVLIEAAACGLPVIASDVPGCREAVVHGETGFLVPVDNAAEIARYACLLLGDRVLADNMGRRGRMRVIKEFSVEAVIEQTMDALRVFQGSWRARRGERASGQRQTCNVS